MYQWSTVFDIGIRFLLLKILLKKKGRENAFVMICFSDSYISGFWF